VSHPLCDGPFHRWGKFPVFRPFVLFVPDVADLS
jgi:hypothetical protein